VLRRIFGPKCGRLHKEEPRNLYSSLNIIRVIKSKRMRWEEYVARMGGMGNAYSISIGKPQWENPLGRPRLRCEGNIRI
jgi:hypothetical protein